MLQTVVLIVTLSTHPVACKTTASVACHQGQGRRDKEHAADCSLNCDTSTHPVACKTTASVACHQGQGRRDKEHAADCSLNCDTVDTPQLHVRPQHQ